jgi:hypothetical protein
MLSTCVYMIRYISFHWFGGLSLLKTNMSALENEKKEKENNTSHRQLSLRVDTSRGSRSCLTIDINI